ncbi:hypothetical protein MTO96_020425 [Rhipicephalus appendiculatus]
MDPADNPAAGNAAKEDIITIWSEAATLFKDSGVRRDFAPAAAARSMPGLRDQRKNQTVIFLSMVNASLHRAIQVFKGPVYCITCIVDEDWEDVLHLRKSLTGHNNVAAGKQCLDLLADAFTVLVSGNCRQGILQAHLVFDYIYLPDGDVTLRTCQLPILSKPIF